MATWIYGLIDPTLHKICYIGRTYQLYDRLEQHVDELASTAKGEWIKRLRAANIRPTLVILDHFEDGASSAIEQWWIEFGRRAGWPLTNTVGVDSDKYNLASLLPAAGQNGYWSSGEWHSLPACGYTGGGEFEMWENIVYLQNGPYRYDISEPSFPVRYDDDNSGGGDFAMLPEPQQDRRFGMDVERAEVAKLWGQE